MPQAEPIKSAAQLWNVRDFGTWGNGRTKDTAALQKALDACARAGGGIVTVPAGIYLTGSLVIGPHTTLRVERRANLIGSPDPGDYPLVKVRWEGEFAQGHRAMLCADRADGLAIEGPGSIIGPPLVLGQLRDPRGPALIEISNSRGVRLENFTTAYAQLWSIHLLLDRDVQARGLTIRSVNFNGDGIDVDSCASVLIEHCNIDTGDDAISLKSGRGQEAVDLGAPTEDVTIRHCTLVSSLYAGLGIGSEMSGGIRRVRIEHCIVGGVQNAILIKSRQGRGGYIEDFDCRDLTILPSPTFLAISLLSKGIQASRPVSGPIDQWPRVDRLSFRGIRVQDVAQLVTAVNVPGERPIHGLTLADISGTCTRGIELAHIEGADLRDIRVTGYSGPLLTEEHVTEAGRGGP